MYWIAGLTLLACLCGGIFLAARSPAFWIGIGKEIIAKILPDIREYISKRNSAEIEAKMHECVRRGGEWDNFRKKCRYK